MAKHFEEEDSSIITNNNHNPRKNVIKVRMLSAEKKFSENDDNLNKKEKNGVSTKTVSENAEPDRNLRKTPARILNTIYSRYRKCEHCDKSFVNAKRLERHQKVHEGGPCEKSQWSARYYRMKLFKPTVKKRGRKSGKSKGDHSRKPSTPEETDDRPGKPSTPEETDDRSGKSSIPEETDDRPGKPPTPEEIDDRSGKPSTPEETDDRPGKSSTPEETDDLPGKPSTSKKTGDRPKKPSTSKKTSNRPRKSSTFKKTGDRPKKPSTSKKTSNRPKKPSTFKKTSNRPRKPPTPNKTQKALNNFVRVYCNDDVTDLSNTETDSRRNVGYDSDDSVIFVPNE